MKQCKNRNFYIKNKLAIDPIDVSNFVAQGKVTFGILWILIIVIFNPKTTQKQHLFKSIGTEIHKMEYNC